VVKGLFSCRLRGDIIVKLWGRIYKTVGESVQPTRKYIVLPDYFEVLEKSRMSKTNGRTLMIFADFEAKKFPKIIKVLPITLDF
jgi:hypothetical protein